MSARPFLKWAGGKTQLLPELLARCPARIDTYFEPFVGAGALFFALAAPASGPSGQAYGHERAPRRAVLADANAELMAAYAAVRDAPEALAERLEALERRYLAEDAAGRERVYYDVRAGAPVAPLDAAARLIFLNKTCFNGLYRVNRRGEFNVPHGRYRAPRIADREGLCAASRALAGVELRTVDFAEACDDARPGDFVYFDPPFHPLSATSSFTQYTRDAFGRAEQLRLKQCIDALTARGVAVLLSNSADPWLRGGYDFAGYRTEEVPARRAINSRGDRRGAIAELLVTNANGMASVDGVSERHAEHLGGREVMDCPGCGQELQRSVWSKETDGTFVKSCPRCSANGGRHVFYGAEAFGYRTPTATGRTIIQSWCMQCRGDAQPLTPAATC